MFTRLIKWNKAYIALLATATMLASCGESKSEAERDTPTSGTIRISVDETYKPLLTSEIKVFESLYPKAHIIAEYKPEADCFKDLLADSARLVIVTRDFNEKEKGFFQELKITPQSMLLAWDGVALITNKSNPDSILTMDQLRKIMDGSETEKKWQIVFDNQNSSTVRFIRDSINQGKPLPASVMAAKTNPEVVDYVAKMPNALGVIGVSWISDPNDSTSIEFNSKVNVVKVRADYGSEFVKPYQAYIALGSYPLKRGFFFCLKEPYSGLGSGFATFLGSYEGQTLIGKFRLFPARLNIVFREANLK
ncbi:phosphate ABC transporter substrate-binding protein, PhoT family [Chitinophaga sp. YR573]|uniref:substrate-binding domain-containing protein n=1 Tax=Chitinophaga sp. YR573 TaxID=1881040 RepID=UPI0008CDE9C8|nr:substrate-binding domain-containing protein [Chitinophaga sp. YR573]SEV99325.1 phosphate ABC transporter substrate-binding protein, PhoT family [Chitinophaga sp. YR573]